MAGNWDWHRRKEYSKREIESLSMLREILGASKPREKRAVISKFNPHFYALFPDGVKHYAEQNEQTATTELSLVESRIFRCEDEEKGNRDGI